MSRFLISTVTGLCHPPLDRWPLACRWVCGVAVMLVATIGSLVLPQGCWGDDVVPVHFRSSPGGFSPSFRVEIDLFEGTQEKPLDQHLILFDGGVVYDLPIGTEPTITVFDPARNRVMLLHKTQRVRTLIPTETLIQLSAQARSVAIDAGAEKSLGMNARMQSTDQPDTYSIEFGDTKYTVTAQRSLANGVAAEFASFSVWACRLNIARQVGSPPFARMTMAEFLAAEGAIPRQVRLEVRRNLKPRLLRADHLYVGRLSDLDRTKIAEVGQMLASFSEVGFAEFPVQ